MEINKKSLDTATARPHDSSVGQSVIQSGQRKRKTKQELYNDSMQNWKKYPIQKAQLIIADVPYNVGNNFYGSNPMWYNGGDNKNGESKLAGKAAFASDYNFNLYEYFHFCSQLMKKEPKGKVKRGCSSDAPCMIVFLRFRTDTNTDKRGKEAWFCKQHSVVLHQKL